MEQKASASAKISANDVGITLPERGFTYVRPHVRGHGGDGADRRTVKVRREKTEKSGEPNE